MFTMLNVDGETKSHHYDIIYQRSSGVKVWLVVSPLSWRRDPSGGGQVSRPPLHLSHYQPDTRGTEGGRE